MAYSHSILSDYGKWRWMGLILLFCSYICLIFPHFSDALADFSYQSVIREDAYAASSINEQEKQALLKNAGIYNQHIFEQQQRMPFAYAGEDASDGTYDSLFEGFSTLCTLEIPSLSLYLPVRKGTKTETLRNGCGHLYGTSIPIGGDNTHAVIAAHSGLTEASLFSEIHLLQKGDLFYLHLLGDLLTYQVDECVTVPAGSEGPYLQIEPGQDRVTLYTCTPIGINTHRLLVKGHRIADGSRGKDAFFIANSHRRDAFMRIMAMILLPALLYLLIQERTIHKQEGKIDVYE